MNIDATALLTSSRDVGKKGSLYCFVLFIFSLALLMPFEISGHLTKE